MTAVRTVTSVDREAWERLFTAYGVFYETTFTPEILDGTWAWLMDDAVQMWALLATADANDDSPVVGFALYRQVLDTFSAGHYLYLEDLYVDPSARGMGVATALIKAISAEGKRRGARTVRWQTALDNTTAQSVYDKLATRTTWVTYEKEIS